MQLKFWNNILVTVLLAVLLFVFTFYSIVFAQQKSETNSVFDSEKAALEAAVNERNAKLAEINKQLEETKKNLDSTRGERVTLQREVKFLDGNIKALDLTIKSDEIQITTLEDEINSLSRDIDHINKSVANKRVSIGETLRLLQKQTDTSIIASLLRGFSLADGVFRADSMRQLQTRLRSDITELSEMEQQMSERMAVKQSRKEEVASKKEILASRKSIIEDQKTERATLLAITKNKEATFQNQLADLQKQQEKIESEIAEFEQKLKAKFDTNQLAGLGRGLFAWPITLVSSGGTGRLTQRYGEVSNLYRGRPHNGMDIGAPIGTPVYAAADGVVMAADNNDRSSWQKYQYGKYVLVRHPDNLASLYGHLSRYIVYPGQNITRGQLIGYSGNTGYSTGPHLHFGVYWAPSIELKSIPPAAGKVPVGVVLNPEDYL